jgi:hypothetical protein
VTWWPRRTSSSAIGTNGITKILDAGSSLSRLDQHNKSRSIPPSLKERGRVKWFWGFFVLLRGCHEEERGVTALGANRRVQLHARSARSLMSTGNLWTASTAAQRTSREPCLVMCPRRTVVSDSWCLGVTCHEHNRAGVENRMTSPGDTAPPPANVVRIPGRHRNSTGRVRSSSVVPPLTERPSPLLLPSFRSRRKLCSEPSRHL